MTTRAAVPSSPFLSSSSAMKSQRINIAGIRREQIVEAAVAVITEWGIQNLSLSEIETRAGMSRGQLTYYFPTKEDILLAVFDRLVVLIHERIGTPAGMNSQEAGAWAWITHLLEKLVTQPPVSPEFTCLQYTFLSQIAHRSDFRQRLANLYEQWRSNMAHGIAEDLAHKADAPDVPPRAMATLVQAILHGLAMQRTADPSSFEPQEMLDLCLDVLGSYLRVEPRPQASAKKSAKKSPAKALAATARQLDRPVAARGVNGERAPR